MEYVFSIYKSTKNNYVDTNGWFDQHLNVANKSLYNKTDLYLCVFEAPTSTYQRCQFCKNYV